MKKRCLLLAMFLLAFLALYSFVFSVHHVAAETDQVELKLQAANSAFEEAFNAVLDAERAGANVTVLLDQLNAAADLLAQAEMAYRNGDAAKAADKADSVLQIAVEVTADAVDAERAASVAYENALWFNSVFSVVGGVVFVLVLVFAWQRVKQRYFGRLRGARPEVVRQ